MLHRTLPIALLFLAACQPKPVVVAADPGTAVSMDFTRDKDFYGAPFPSDDLIPTDGGYVDMSAFPNPGPVLLVSQVQQMVSTSAHAFAQAGGVFFELSADLDAAKLPSLNDSVQPGATVFLMGVQKGAPDYLKRYAVTVVENANSSFFGPMHMLAVVPLQGLPLRPATRYAAVVLRSALDVSDKELGRTLDMAQLAAGQQPAGMPAATFEEYVDAIAALGSIKISSDSIAGMAVFTTDTPQTQFAAVVSDMLAQPTPVPQPFTLTAMYSNFCEFSSTVQIPDYQAGTPPFNTTGGNWEFDANGKPILQNMATADVFVSIPMMQMPPNGYPAVDFVPAGGGTALPLIDRGLVNGVQDAPGNGPATEYAKVNWAGMSIDGPLDGARNPTGNPDNEDNLYFNLFNPPALRDNLREAGAEAVLHAHILANLKIDTTGCPGAVTAGGSTLVHFDAANLVVQGHSMGASIVPMPIVYEPLFRAMIVDGAGASYIQNIEFKVLPSDALEEAEAYLNYFNMPLLGTDPILTLVQWAAEPSDTQVFARNIVQEPINGSVPRDVLMFQGIVDHYIMPPIANSLTLSLGIDLAGIPIDAGNPGYTAADTPIMDVIGLSGRSDLPTPVTGNFGAYTAVVKQNPGDGVEDGHEAMFQTEPPKNQYRCFLQTLAAGGPPTVTDGLTDTCP